MSEIMHWDCRMDEPSAHEYVGWLSSVEAYTAEEAAEKFAAHLADNYELEDGKGMRVLIVPERGGNGTRLDIVPTQCWDFSIEEI